MAVNDDVRAEIDAFAAASKSAMARNDLDAVLATMTDDVNRTGVVGGPIRREDVAHGTTLEVLPGTT